MLLLVAYVAMLCAQITRNSFSVFYPAIIDSFAWSRADTASIFSINMLVYGLMAPWAGGLVDRVGPRRVLLVGTAALLLSVLLSARAQNLVQFYLAFGGAGAVGVALIGYPVSATVLMRCFTHHRGLVFGIFISAGSASFLFTPVIHVLISTLGWRMSFLVLAVVIGATLPALILCLIRPGRADVGSGPHTALNRPARTHSDARIRRGSALSQPRFWLFLSVYFIFFGLVQNFFVVHHVTLFEEIGLSSERAASMVGIWGVAAVVGTIIAFSSDRWGRVRMFMAGSGMVTLSLLLLLGVALQWFHWVQLTFLYCVFSGVGMGMCPPSLGAAFADTFQGRHFGMLNGVMIMGFGFGGFVGPWVGGLIFDVTGSYGLVLAVSLLLTALTTILVWVQSRLATAG